VVSFAVRCIHLRVRLSSDLLFKEPIPWLCGLELHCVSNLRISLVKSLAGKGLGPLVFLFQ
jgi:hypothetical protein